jgi:hypothetical protein
MKCNQLIVLFLILIGIVSCSDDATYEDCRKTGWHKISFSEFSIVTPSHVRYLPQKGQDSFVGDLIGDSISMTFDYGAYSNPLVPTPEEYIKSERWLGYVIQELFFNMRMKDTTVNYPSENEFTTIAITPDSSDEWTYHVKLKFRDSILNQTFIYPREFQKYEFETDTIENKYIKIVYPMVSQKGLMGVYIEDLIRKKERSDFPRVLMVEFMTEEFSDEYKLDILRSVRMK